MARNRDISKLLSTSNGKIAGANLDVSFENITDTGTEGTKVASGTTAQRGSTTGQFRFNSTTGKFEGRNASDFISIEVSPSVTSVNNANPTEDQITAGFDLVITGSNFASGDTVTFIGNDNTSYTSPTVTVDSGSQITARIPTNIDASKEPFKVKIANTGGLTGELASAFNINQNPSWSTAAGTIAGGFQGDNINTTVTASDPEGTTVVYSETTSVLSGIGTGFTLNTSTGAITGTLPNVGSGTTYTFTIRATAGSQTSDRQFSIYNAGTGTQTIHTSSTTLNVGFTRPIKVYAIGGGGGGAGELNQGSCGSAGGGGGGLAYKLLNNVSAGNYTITVGDGGLGGYHTGNSDEHGTAGGTSSFSGTGITTVQATGGAGGTDSDNSSNTEGVGGAGGIGSGGDINGTGGAGGNGRINAQTVSGHNAGAPTNNAAGGGGGGTDSSSNGSYKGGNGSNGTSAYFTGGGGGGGCDGDGTNISSSQRGIGGTGYSSGGNGGGQTQPATAGSDTSGTSSGGATNQLTGTRNNNGGGGGAFGGGGGGTGSADGGQISGGCGGRGAIVLKM